MSKAIDVTGQKFGKLTAIKVIGRIKKEIKWLCLCDCGEEVITVASALRLGRVVSCKECKKNRAKKLFTTHGHTSNGKFSTTYSSWSSMISRGTNKNRPNSKNYVGRGIIVCDRWLGSFENFLEDMGEKPKGTSIDRVDNDGIYEPNNCVWSNRKTQARNRRSNRQIMCIQNNTIYDTIAEAAEKLMIHRNCISDVLNGRQQHTRGYVFIYLDDKIN